jgi:hypothetical protein
MITVPGELVIKTIHGRNGDFNVGRLFISIGEYVVKDKALEQYDEGKYAGDFVICEIRAATYSSGGRLVVENRAYLGGMALSGIDGLSSEEADKLAPQEVDPLETDAQEPTPAAPKPDPLDDMTPFGMEPEAEAPDGKTGSANEADETLFGTVWPLAEVVKLDSTVGRLLLRQQKKRLAELGYGFKPMTQDWHRQAQ